MSPRALMIILAIASIAAVANALWYRRHGDSRFLLRTGALLWLALAFVTYSLWRNDIAFAVMTAPALVVIIGSVLFQEADALMRRTRRVGAVRALLLTSLPAIVATLAAFVASMVFEREALAYTLAVIAGIGWTVVLWGIVVIVVRKGRNRT